MCVGSDGFTLGGDRFTKVNGRFDTLAARASPFVTVGSISQTTTERHYSKRIKGTRAKSLKNDRSELGVEPTGDRIACRPPVLKTGTITARASVQRLDGKNDARVPHPCRVLCGKGGSRYCPSRIGMTINGSLSFRIICQPDAVAVCLPPFRKRTRKDGAPGKIYPDSSTVLYTYDPAGRFTQA